MTYTTKVSPAVKDRAGNNMNAEYPWTFTTENEPDIVSPKVVVQSLPINKMRSQSTRDS